jgi:hypothetical protein
MNCSRPPAGGLKIFPCRAKPLKLRKNDFEVKKITEKYLIIIIKN